MKIKSNRLLNDTRSLTQKNTWALHIVMHRPTVIQITLQKTLTAFGFSLSLYCMYIVYIASALTFKSAEAIGRKRNDWICTCDMCVCVRCARVRASASLVTFIFKKSNHIWHFVFATHVWIIRFACLQHSTNDCNVRTTNNTNWMDGVEN